jgi:hypothetical protein
VKIKRSVITFAAMIAIPSVGCSLKSSNGGIATPRSYEATYQVIGEDGHDGPGAADITYNNEDGGVEQRLVRAPREAKDAVIWSKSFKVRPGTFLYISAQNHNRSGYVTTYILINGEPRKTSTSAGAFVIASSSYRCCE